MRIGVGLGFGSDPAAAAARAARAAARGVPAPDITLAFASVRLDQRAVHRGLAAELDMAKVLGGSSYAEITDAGVTRGSVAVLSASFDGAPVRFARTDLRRPARQAADVLAAGLGPVPASGRPLALVFGGPVADGRDDATLARARSRLGAVPLFGGMTCGDYDLGLSHPRLWENWQYGPRLTRSEERAALIGLPDGYEAAFGFEHGWEPVGPPFTVTRARGGDVYEIDGVPIFDYYRQLLGGEHDRAFFELLIQRYGFALPGADGRTLLKLPVFCDFRRGFIQFIPFDRLQGRQARLILASRRGLVAGARTAAERCRAALRGRRPDLLLMVSCCTRSRILHSRIGDELDAVRSVFGARAPVFGFYSSGEIAPYASDYAAAADPAGAGSHYHATTVALLAISAPKPARAGARPRPPAHRREGRGEAVRLRRALADSEETLDRAETVLANLSRKSYQDAEKLRRQNEVIHRYTPHGVWKEAGARASRGEYELPDRALRGAFLFMDVRGFTAYSEAHGPARTVSALNALFGPATDAIHACGGDVDKYIGDCIFAAFRSPAAAVRAARRLLAVAAAGRAAGRPFDVRIGVNAGRAVRANVGSRDRREYTYIGDAVNLAQRLESRCAPGRALVSAAAYRAAPGVFPAAARRRLRVKGRARAVTAYDCVPA